MNGLGNFHNLTLHVKSSAVVVRFVRTPCACCVRVFKSRFARSPTSRATSGPRTYAFSHLSFVRLVRRPGSHLEMAGTPITEGDQKGKDERKLRKLKKGEERSKTTSTGRPTIQIHCATFYLSTQPARNQMDRWSYHEIRTRRRHENSHKQSVELTRVNSE